MSNLYIQSAEIWPSLGPNLLHIFQEPVMLNQPCYYYDTHVPHMNYLARSVPPHLLNEAADIHNKITKSTFQEIVGLSTTDDNHWNQVSPKITFGGFGMTLINQMMHAAFIVAWCQTAVELPRCFPYMSEDIEKSIARELCDGLQGTDIIVTKEPHHL